MFTDGLDDTAINWIKKGSAVERRETRSPLLEKLDQKYHIPRSPLAFSSSSFASSHSLPPLKFHSDLIKPVNTVTLSVDGNEDESDYYKDDDETESVGSAPEEMCGNHSDEDGVDKPVPEDSDEEMLDPKLRKRFNDGKYASSINRGLLKENLRVEIPRSVRGYTDRLSNKVQPHSAYGTPIGKLNDALDLGTPSAPPVLDNHSDLDSEVGREKHHYDLHEVREQISGPGDGCLNNEVDKREDEEKLGDRELPASSGYLAKSFTPYYDASGQNAWQALVAYDACIRLCLNSWARGYAEAPEFLRDECLLLRNAFGLHKLLLQPRGVHGAENNGKTTEQAMPSKVKRIVGKIRVEESMVCLVHLKSSVEENEMDRNSVISLRPGSSEYHDFFPESEADALLLEVQDVKRNTQGFATIPVSSLTDNPNDRIRWWPIHINDNECAGKVLLSIGSTFTSDETVALKSGSIVETLAYDLLLEAAMRAEQFHARNLRIGGHWKWILKEFAEYYGVSDSYTQLRHLYYVMNVATPTKDCLELVHELLVPVLKARNERILTRQEKSILLDCETQVESLLSTTFQNYKSLDEKSPTGLVDIAGPILDIAAPALAPAVQVYTLLHDILSQDAQTMLRKYLQMAATKRCRKHMFETDELVSSNSDCFVMDSGSICTAYSKMKTLCINISNEIQADIKIHNQHVFPSSIDLSSITSSVYSTELCKRLKTFLATWPPSSPLPHVNDLLIAMSEFERSLELWNISPVHGGVDSQELYDSYIMVWIQDLQLTFLDLCKAEKVPWSGVATKYSTSPFAEDMFEKTTKMLTEYEVVINRWPQYTLILENAAANVERAIIKAMERQYNDILTPLKDSIPKRLGMQVQKLARRQSTTTYSIPSQLGIFLNTMKRILDVLHCRIEDKLKSWASYLPINGDSKSTFGEQMNAITVLLRRKYKNYVQAIVVKLAANLQANRSTRLQRILEDTKEADGVAEIRDRMQLLSTQLFDSISHLHESFTSQIFVAATRAFWDKMGQIVLKFLECRKENRIWYTGSYHALGILDDIYASQMQRLLGNALQEKDLEPPRSITEARSILSRDSTNRLDSSSYLY
ncbi:hypothetical protein F511_35699 [Dorcoceras hygrometricum]|uniref:Uncharacterized protein n=1 Tax=Dorcoceras hygrometricum TaxID=472368 RepID=A0A2Z7D7B5_9LAMI|nr:hypothetical protein F511_35699 [Dorcoceras hygrometricum]